MGKSHVMNVIDLRTAKKYQPIRDILDIDLAIDDWYEKSEKAREILHKQAKSVMKSQRENERRERENYEKNPGNFFTVKMETKKCATKVGETVTITSLVESTIEVKDFAKDRFFGKFSNFNMYCISSNRHPQRLFSLKLSGITLKTGR